MSMSLPMYRNISTDSFDRVDTSPGGAGTNTGAGNGWVDVQGGVAQISGHRLKLTSDAIDTGQFARDFVVRPPSEATLDHSIEFDMPAQVWNSAASFGPALRYQSSSKNAYSVRFHGDGTLFQMYKVIGGTPTAIGGGGLTFSGYSQGTNYRIRFSIEGTNLNFEITNLDTGAVGLNIQTTDSTIATPGTAGFCGPWDVTGTSIYLDNTTVSSSATIKLGIIGDSISANIPPSGLKSPGNSLGRELATRTRRECVIANRAVSGTASGDWISGGSQLPGAKTAFAAAGVTDVHVMIGTNDSKTAVATPKATYKSNVSSLCNDLVSAGYRVFLAAPPYLTPGAYSQFDVASLGFLHQYRDALSELSNGTTIILGDTKSYKYFERFQNELADLLHPTVDGGESIAGLWADAIWTYFV